MFQAIGNFFGMFATLFAAGNTAAESLNDFASLGRIKSQTMLREEQLRTTADLKRLEAELLKLESL